MTTMTRPFDFSVLRKDFPVLQQKNRGKPLVYLDSAATAQKPVQVIDAMTQFYREDYASVHRGIYELSERASALYENVRLEVKNFIHAPSEKNIVFVRGTTEGINLVAQGLGQLDWQAGDEVLVSVMEHHSNIVPWHLLRQRIGIKIKVIPMKEDGSLDIPAYQQLFTPRTRLVAVCHASNVLGTINPIAAMTAFAHARNVPVLVDGAQAVPHLPVNVQQLDCDFYVFSGHKLYGPTGAGVLYAKPDWLERLPPYQGGGGMINTVSFNEVTYAKAPYKFEAGTPDIASVIGLGAAIRYVKAIGMEQIYQHEQVLLQHAEASLNRIPGLQLIGTAHPKVGVLSWVMESLHPHDMSTVLDHEGIAVRAGHHCAMPLMEHLGLAATARASLGIYNNEQEIDALVQAIRLAVKVLG